MKIGFDAKRLYSNFSGLGNYSRSLVKNLQEFHPENEYHLYTPKLIETSETSFFSDNPYFNTHLAKSLFKSYWRSISIVNQLKKDGVELYHGLSNEIPLNLKKSKIKSIVTIHDLIFKVLPETYPRIDRKIYDLKFRNSCENADKIIAISDSTKRDIVQFYNIDPDKIEVIYQSCNPLFYESIEKDRTDMSFNKQIPNEFLLFVGNIEKRKNINLILEAYKYIEPALKIPLLVIGGGRSYTQDFKNFITANKLQNEVIWISDLVDNTNLKMIYRKATALVYPSHYEGFGLPVVEALLSKTPVITSNTSSLPEAGGPKSRYIDPNSPQELGAAINEVLSSEDLRNEMIQTGYEYANEKFAPDHLTHQLMECYESILHS